MFYDNDEYQATDGRCDCGHRHHWQLEGDEPSIAWYFRAGRPGCSHDAHRYDTAYWGICHSPDRAAELTSKLQKHHGSWFWFLSYRDEPSALQWFESEADAVAEGQRIVAGQTATSSPLVRCDLVAADYLQLCQEQGDRHAECRREYEEWKAQQTSPGRIPDEHALIAEAVREHRCPRCKADPGNGCIIRSHGTYGGVHAARTSIVARKWYRAQATARRAAAQASCSS